MSDYDQNINQQTTTESNTDDSLITLVTRRKEQSAKLRDSEAIAGVWKDIDELYTCQLPDADAYDYRSRLFIPELYTQLETLLPRIIDGIFDGDDFFGLTGQTPEYNTNAEYVKQELDYQFQEEIDLTPSLIKWLHSAVKHGTKFCVKTWNVEKQTHDIRGVSKWDIFPDPYGEDIDDCDYIIIRSKSDLETLYKMEEQKIYQNCHKLENKSGAGKKPDQKEINELTARGINLPQDTNDDAKNPIFDIYDMWTKTEVITVELSNKVVLRHKKIKEIFDHKKKPLFLLRPRPEEGIIYGIPPLAPIRVINHEMNDRRNQRMDYVNFNLNPMYKKLRTANIADYELVTRPRGIINTDDMNGLEVLRPTNLGITDGIQEEEIMRNDCDRAMGTYDTNRGEATTSSTTATEVTTRIQQSNIRYNWYVNFLRVEGIKRMLELCVSDNQQFLTVEKQIMINGVPKTITPEMRQGNFKITFTRSSGHQNKMLQKESIKEMLMTPIQANPYLNIPEMLNSWALDVGLDPKKVIIPNPQLPNPNAPPEAVQ